MADAHQAVNAPVTQSSMDICDLPSTVAHRPRRDRVHGGRMCAMLVFNAVVACAALSLFILWNDGRLPMATWQSGIFSSSTASKPDDMYNRRVITPEVSELVQRLAEGGHVRGLSVGVVRWSPQSNADIEFGSWGTMSEHGANVTADTLFNIGSCSKAFLAVTMGILMEDFRLGENKTALPTGLSEFTWNSRISDLLPADEWGLADEWATKEATVADILSHVSGLPRHDFAWNYDDSTLDVVKRLRHLKTTHGLRQEWDYNNQMYILGAHIISRYAGVPYTQYATERVFGALGMDATTFDPSVAQQSGNLSDAWSYTGRRIPLWFGSDASEMLAGPGGIISNARDMTKWISALVPSVLSLQPQDSLLPPRVLADVSRARAIIEGRSASPELSIMSYGLGWMRITYLGNELLYHDGSIPGYRAIVMLLPRKSAGVVVLANTDGITHAYVAFVLIHSILGLPLVSEHLDMTMAFPEYSGLVPTIPAFQGYPQAHPENLLFQDIACPELQPKVQPISLERFAGTYANRGYGNLTLCAPSTASAYCDRVRTAFALTHNDTSTDAAPALLGEWPRLLATHVRLAHPPHTTSRDTFLLTPHYIFPEGYGEDSSPFDYELYQSPYGLFVECAAVDAAHGEHAGCGVYLTYDGYLYRKKALPLHERVDVWYEKVA